MEAKLYLPGRKLGQAAYLNSGFVRMTMAADSTRESKPMGTLFRMALMSGDIAAINLHLRRGVDPNAIDSLGRSALMVAATRGHLDACRALLDAGACRNYRDREGRNAISVANQKTPQLLELLTDEVSIQNSDVSLNGAKVR
ncbi:MAG: ankyrin repeat domain-containing protein, partial [Arenimonas sp.]